MKQNMNIEGLLRKPVKLNKFSFEILRLKSFHLITMPKFQSVLHTKVYVLKE